MSQGGTRKETRQKQIIIGFIYGELRTFEAKGSKDTLQNKSAFSASRIDGRGAEEDTAGLDFRISHK